MLSCGKPYWRIRIREKKYTYVIGEIYGVKKLEELFRDDNNKLSAIVTCVYCGKRSIVRPHSLFNQKNTSCTCQMRTIDGESGSKLYSVYANIKYRCYNQNAHCYHNYGGRGIKLCDEWIGRNGFNNFKNWALQNGYSEGLTIDRINVNGDYSPDNCRWVTLSENVSHANKDNRVQHRKSNGGTYYVKSHDGVITTFENASQYAKEHGLNPNRVRDAARKNKQYLGMYYGYAKNLPKEPQSTIKSSMEQVEYGCGETPQPEAPSIA